MDEIPEYLIALDDLQDGARVFVSKLEFKPHSTNTHVSTNPELAIRFTHKIAHALKLAMAYRSATESTVVHQSQILQRMP